MLKESAFTLIEVSLAMAILLIGVVGVATLVPLSIDANMRSKNMAAVTMLAESKIEEMKKVAAISATNWEGLVSISTETPFSPPYDNFKWKTKVDPAKTSTGVQIEGLKQVTLSIIWTTRAKTLNENFDFFVAKR